MIDHWDSKRKARFCTMLLYASFPVVLAAVVIGWLVHPDGQEQSEPLSFLLAAPVGPMLIARGVLMLSSEEVRHEVAHREPKPFGMSWQATKAGAVGSIIGGLYVVGIAVSGALDVLG